MFYWFNILLVIVYYFYIRVAISDKNKANDVFIRIVIVHAVLFRALANPWNYVDSGQYVNGFMDIAKMNINEAFFSINEYSDWGQFYVLLNWVVSRFSENPISLYVVLALVTVGGTLWFYYKTSYTILSTLLLYFLYPMMYLMGFGVVRQHLSLVFVLWALYYIDNFKVSFPLAIIGVLCHTSALIIIPFFFFRKIDIRRYNYFNILLGAIVIAVIGRVVISYVLSFFLRYQEVLESGEKENNTVPIVLIFSSLIALFVTRAFYNIEKEKDRKFVNFMIYGFGISVFCYGLPGGGRLTLPFIYLLPVIISYCFKYGNNKLLFLSKAYSFMVFLLTFLQIYLSLDSENRINDYLFLWEEVV